ncbi:MAG: hypothetical protein IJV39_03235 [Ruminococcus sp.]|nr:hypothetical protein [Ruminococcus sp.]
MAKHAAHAADDNKPRRKQRQRRERESSKSVQSDRNYRRNSAESLKRSENEYYTSKNRVKTLHSSDSELYVRKHSDGTDFIRGEMPVRYNKPQGDRAVQTEDVYSSKTLRSEVAKPRRSHYSKSSKASDSRRAQPADDKPKGKGIIIVTAIVCVIISVCIGCKIYFDGIAENNNTQSQNKTTSQNITYSENQDDYQSTLVVVTVSGKTIEYNSETVSSPEELEKLISAVKNPTLSLINIDADIDTYNSVAKVLNKHGVNYELMDVDNTSPSIKNEEDENSEE